MIERLITMFAILAISVVTTVTSAHAARMSMSSGPDHAVHVGEMIHTSVSTELSCDGARHCGSADSELCEFVCAGLSAFLTSPSADAGLERRLASHDIPSEASHVSCAPGMNEHPPKPRLL